MTPSAWSASVPTASSAGLSADPLAGAPAEADDGEHQYRSTLSWPPDRRVRIGVTVLCSIVIVVLVALLLANGRLGRPRTAANSSNASEAIIPEGWVTYRDPAGTFEIAHPAAWTAAPRDSATLVSDPASGASLRVSHTTEPGTPERLTREREDGVAAATTDYRRLQLEPTALRGLSAAVWEYTFTEAGRPYHAVNVELVDGLHRYTLYFQTHAADWDQFLSTFHSFANAFKPVN